MTPEQLSAHLTEILYTLSNEGRLNVDLPETVKVERPKNRDHGDWATNIALQLGKRAGLTPRELAEMIAEKLTATPGVASVDIAGPGFINVTLDTAAAAEIARTIVEAGATYGNNDALAGHNINMEFVSANPTGPLHIGHTRWAALGDSIVRMLRASGADVTAEYYINDAGSQMDVFATSIYRRMHGLEVQEGGYPGQYIADMAEQILADDPSVKDLSEAEALPVLRERGYALQMKDIKDTLADFGVHFDVYFSESDLHNQGKIEEAVARLKEQGHVYEEDGAIWLRTSEFGDDKDRVLIRANGAPTYFAADAAYYLNKRDRGFAEKIYLLGADHHGYIGRLKAIAAAAGDDADTNIEILIGQLMSVNGARLSKRAGNIIELKDLIEWLGTRQAARAAADRGVDRSVFDASLLNHPAENDLLAALTAYPSAVAAAAQRREPHRVARHIESVAAAYHTWYAACRITPVGEEAVEDVHRTRLWLNDATTTVIANGLELLGVSAPEKM